MQPKVLTRLKLVVRKTIVCVHGADDPTLTNSDRDVTDTSVSLGEATNVEYRRYDTCGKLRNFLGFE